MITAFLESQRARALAAKTISRRRTALLGFGRFLAPRPVTEATADDIEAWLRTLAHPTTMHHYRSDLNCFYRWAVRRGIVPNNPVEATDSPRMPRALPRPLKPEQIAAALMVADADTRVMILLGSHAGLRISEIARLHSDDLSLASNPPTLVVRNGKGGKDRVLPVHPVLAAALRGRPSGWVFPGAHAGRPVAVNTVRVRVQEAFAAIGVTMVPHQLRHSFGSVAAQMAAGNLLVVAMLMGHESVSTTQGYVGWAPTEEARRVVESLYVGPKPLDGGEVGRMMQA